MEVKGFFPACRKNRRLVKYFFKFKKLLESRRLKCTEYGIVRNELTGISKRK